MALNNRQELFCLEYLKDLNGSQAAIRAGYSEHTAYSIASENLRKPEIRSRVQELMKDRSENILVDGYYVVESLIENVRRCQQAEPVLVWDSEEKKMVPSGEWQFDSQGANKALELLGKHLEMFSDKIKHSGSIDNPSASPETLLAIADKINANAANNQG